VGVPLIHVLAWLPLWGVEAPEAAETAAAWRPLVVERCEEALAEAGVTRYLPRPWGRPVRLRGADQRSSHRCYVPQAIEYQRGPGNLGYTGHMRVNCALALALARFEEILQEEAARHFGPGRRVSWISTYGTVSCRLMRGRESQSQHSLGNAIDIRSFNVPGWGRVEVAEDWVARRRGRLQASFFLRALHGRLKDEHVFSVVLGPEDGDGHANHLHFDLTPPLPPWLAAQIAGQSPPEGSSPHPEGALGGESPSGSQ
jgi:hypothetical protein